MDVKSSRLHILLIFGFEREQDAQTLEDFRSMAPCSGSRSNSKMASVTEGETIVDVMTVQQ